MITIDPDNLLASDFELITDNARAVVHQLHTLDLSVQNGDVNPEQASAELRKILAPLQIQTVAQSWMKSEPAPETVNTDRFFTDGTSQWRVRDGKIHVSGIGDGEWEDSCFITLDELQSCIDVQEIPDPETLP